MIGQDADGQDVTLSMILIPPGEFTMGASDEERTQFLEGYAKAAKDEWAAGRIPNEGPPHQVRITRPFYLGKYEVTQAQWQSVMETNPAKFDTNSARPVEQVNWNDIQPYLTALNERGSFENVSFVLPTEAQWEYACRAGTTTYWQCGDDPSPLRQYGWFHGHAQGTTHPVGELKPNAFGLYDLHGNVWEWCADRFAKDFYTSSPLDDPTGPVSGADRSIRGGCAMYHANYCRSASREYNRAGHRFAGLGFRLAASIKTSKSQASAAATQHRAVNLLALIEPERDALDPGVRMENGLLYTPRFNSTNTRVVIPYSKVPAEYDIRLVAVRLGEDRFGLNLGFLMNGRQAVLDMDGSKPPKWCISRIDGMSMQDGNVTTVEGKRFQLGKKVTVDLQVRQGGIKVLCDGETVIDWQGRPEQLTLWEKLELPDPKTLFFFSQAEFAIHELTLTPVASESPDAATEDAETGNNPLPAGTTWLGTRTYRRGGYAGTTVHYELHVREREGTQFKGHVFDNGKGRNRADVAGEIEEDSLHWTEKARGNVLTTDGSLSGDTIHLTFKGQYSNGVTNQGDGELTRIRSNP